MITRFFLFSECVWALLRCLMMQLPVDILSTSTSSPGPQNSKRLRRVVNFYADPRSLPALKRAGLCLRIGMLAVSISSKKNATDVPTQPLSPSAQ